MKRNKNLGVDLDIDQIRMPKPAVIAAHIVYWDCHQDIISQPTIYAETVYPLTLPQAIQAFRPELAKGANINFEYINGDISITNIIVF